MIVRRQVNLTSIISRACWDAGQVLRQVVNIYTVANTVLKPDSQSVRLWHGAKFADKVFEQARPGSMNVFGLSQEYLGIIVGKNR